jgi:hypothetical protein
MLNAFDSEFQTLPGKNEPAILPFRDHANLLHDLHWENALTFVMIISFGCPFGEVKGLPSTEQQDYTVLI